MSVTLDEFIARELKALETYDNQRPAGHPYAFHEHTQRVAADMFALAKALGKNNAEAERLHDLTLVHDIGKRRLPVEIWDLEGKPPANVRAQRYQHTKLGVEIVDETFGKDNHDGDLDLMRDLMLHHHEAMDGSGWLGIKGEYLSYEARMLCVCDAYDGYSTWRPHFGNRDLTPKGVLHRMATEKAGQFDPAILSVFSTLKTV